MNWFLDDFKMRKNIWDFLATTHVFAVIRTNILEELEMSNFDKGRPAC